MRCEANLSKDYLRAIGDRETQCRRIADYKLEGKCFCAEHASMLLLALAKAAGTIKAVKRDFGARETRRART